jgi:predicted enzyme related to lactoylglutathione lyase
MPTANPVNWFEIPASDLDRAQRFYELVLEIQMARNEMGALRMAWFPMTRDGDGATGSLVQNEHYQPSHAGSMVYFSVDDIEATLERVEANGGRTLNPRTAIGEFGFTAHFEDSEGNRVALHSET